MLNLLHIRRWPRLARRLLEKRPGIVLDTCLYAIVIYALGCVIPTPLDQAPTPTNYRPVFVTDQVNPSFGQLTRTQADVFELNLVVDDPDVSMATSNDDLRARLFFPSLMPNAPLLYTGYEATFHAQSPPDPMNPNFRYATFGPASFCAGRSGTSNLFVIVSDRQFDMTDPTKTAGLTDENHWELTCN